MFEKEDNLKKIVQRLNQILANSKNEWFSKYNYKNDDDKKRALYLLESIITRIIHDGFVLKDITGLTTHWGVWAPEDLNGEFVWSDERGLNSLQILSYFKKY